MHLDDGAIRSLQKDLIPAAHRPTSVIGERNVSFAQHRLEGLDVIDAKRDVAALYRVEALLAPESHPKILLSDMKLCRSIREELDLVTVAVIAIPLFVAARHRLQVEH